jgi:hypothetical protein
MSQSDTIRATHLVRAYAMSARLSAGTTLVDTLASIRKVTR